MSWNVLMTHWKDSLEFFKPSNLKLFMLASLNCFVRSLRVVPKNPFWLWIILAVLYYLFFLSPFFLKNPSLSIFTIFPSFLLFYFASAQVLFFSVLAARPSVERKDKQYFISFLGKRYWRLASFYCAIFSVPYFLLALPVMTILFLLDNQITFKNFLPSIRRGFQMILHFILPVGFLTGCIMIPLYTIVWITRCSCWQFSKEFLGLAVLSWLARAGLYFIVMLLQVFYICMLTTYYIKLKHTYKDFFFGKPDKIKK